MATAMWERSVGVEEQAVLKALRSGRIGTEAEVDAFEGELASTYRCHAVTTSSGSSAIELVLRAQQIGRGDTVLVRVDVPVGGRRRARHRCPTRVRRHRRASPHHRPGRCRSSPRRRRAGDRRRRPDGCAASVAALRKLARPRDVVILHDAAASFGLTTEPPAPGVIRVRQPARQQALQRRRGRSRVDCRCCAGRPGALPPLSRSAGGARCAATARLGSDSRVQRPHVRSRRRPRPCATPPVAGDIASSPGRRRLIPPSVGPARTTAGTPAPEPPSRLCVVRRAAARLLGQGARESPSRVPVDCPSTAATAHCTTEATRARPRSASLIARSACPRPPMTRSRCWQPSSSSTRCGDPDALARAGP